MRSRTSCRSSLAQTALDVLAVLFAVAFVGVTAFAVLAAFFILFFCSF
jgi:hypothetical protein